MRFPGSVRLVGASIAVHALVLGAAVWQAEKPEKKEAPVLFEVVKRARAAQPVEPPPPRVAEAPPEAPPEEAPVAAPRVVRARVALAPDAPGEAGAGPAVELPPPEDEKDEAPLGAGLGRTYAPPVPVAAPPAPPPPPPPALPAPRFVDEGWENLYTLLRSWQHNDSVRRCMAKALGAGDVLVAAVRTGDRLTAIAEVKKLRDDGAPTSTVLYGRARKCLTSFR